MIEISRGETVNAEALRSDPRHALSEHLLAAQTATAALTSWCVTQNLGSGPINVIKQSGCRVAHPGRGILDRLRPRQDEHVLHRRVLLVRSGIVLSRADNWYIPQRLPSDIRQALDVGNRPFGALIARLHPVRHTFFVSMPNLDGAADEAAPILLHRAAVFRSGGPPLAVVDERYAAILLAPAEAGSP